MTPTDVLDEMAFRTINPTIWDYCFDTLYPDTINELFMHIIFTKLFTMEHCKCAINTTIACIF